MTWESDTAKRISDQWRTLAEKFAIDGLTAEEILAVVMSESNGDAGAINPLDPSYGLMGVSLLIGGVYGQVTNAEQLYDPEINVRAGSWYLNFLKKKYAERFPLDGVNGWVQIYNLGETKFLKGVRHVGYEEAFVKHWKSFQGVRE
jgi:hypothetical protein